MFRVRMPAPPPPPARMPLRAPRQASIHALDEHVRRRWAGRRAIARVVIERRARRFDLLERHLLRDHRLDAIADDRDHVAVFDYVELVTDASVPGDDERAPLFVMRRNREVQYLVQTVDDALDAAALLHIDDRIAVGPHDVAGGDDVGLAGEHDAV